MNDPDVVDVSHCLFITQLGLKAKVTDSDYLLGLVELINHHGPTIVFGKLLIKAITFLIQSIKINMTGNNANGKVQRD